MASPGIDFTPALNESLKNLNNQQLIDAAHGPMANLGLSIGKWLASNVIPLLAVYSLFLIGMLLIQVLVGIKKRQDIAQRMKRYLIGYVFLGVIMSGLVFGVIDRLVTSLDYQPTQQDRNPDPTTGGSIHPD